VRKQNSPTGVRICMMVLTVLSCSAIALAQKTASDFQRPRHNAAVPFIDIISPTAARVHGAGFILTLDGAGFGPDAEVGFQLGSITHPLPTLVLNEGEVAAYVPAKLLQDAATASITVANHQRHGDSLPSNPVLLPITKPTANVTFTPASIPFEEGPAAIVTADFNGDGQPDLAIIERCASNPSCSVDTTGNIVILLGKHDGTFSTQPPIPVDNLPTDLATGDFNGDGKIDLAVTNNGAPTVTILFGDGLGGFTPAASTVPVDGNAQYIKVGDFNRDGKLDLAVGLAGFIDQPCSPTGCGTDVISIRLGRGDGTFTAAAPVQQSGGGIQTLAVADVNRDGILDLMFENGASPYLYIYAGHGDGTFSALPSPTLPPFADLLPGAAYADVNRDGNLDLVSTVSGVPGEGQTTIFTAFGKGNGQFHDSHTSAVANEIFIGGVAFGDFNGDGKLDMVEEAGLFDLKYDFFLGNGHNTFNLNNSVDLSTDSGPVTPVVADFNGDGKLDLATITGDNHGGTVAILLQQ
jgi:FG-GAP-like repeat